MGVRKPWWHVWESIDYVDFSVMKQSEQKVRAKFKTLRTAAVMYFLLSLTLPTLKSPFS